MNTTRPDIAPSPPHITSPADELSARVANVEGLLGRFIDWAATGRDDLELQSILADYEQTIGR